MRLVVIRAESWPEGREGNLFIADFDLRRLPSGGGFIVPAVQFFKSKVVSAKLLMIDGRWLILPPRPDPEGIDNALVALTKQRFATQPNAAYWLSEANADNIRVLVQQPDTVDELKWAVAIHWHSWNCRGLSHGERIRELAKFLKSRAVAKWSVDTFKTTCRRLGLKKVKQRNVSN